MKDVKLLILAFCLVISWAASAQISEKVRLNGYSSFEFERLISDDGDSDPNGSFDADLIDLVINVDVSSKLRFSTDLTWEHGTATEDGRGNVAVEYAFPEYTVKNWLKFRVGKMFTPFGIYNEIHTAKPAFLAVKEPLSTNKPDKLGGDERFYPRWATGISVLGNFLIKSVQFEYHIQVSNGSQENTNPFEEDDNTQKAVATRLLVYPIPDLKVGVSTYSDRISVLDTNGDDTGERDKLFSISGHAEYSRNNYGAEFEYIVGNTDFFGGPELKKNGLEALVYYTLGKRWTPYVRVEFFDPNQDLDDDNVDIFSLGLNVEVDKNYFVKLQYNSVDSGDANSDIQGIGFTEFQAAVVLGF